MTQRQNVCFFVTGHVAVNMLDVYVLGVTILPGDGAQYNFHTHLNLAIRLLSTISSRAQSSTLALPWMHRHSSRTPKRYCGSHGVLVDM